MSLTLLSLLLFAGFLTWERVRLQRIRRRVPLCIAVTGTRGKSGVVRMIASALRQGGARVLAKTTGTSPCFILPDGREEAIRRRGRPSILEQKQVLRKAAQLKVDYLVVEVMSLRPENHFVEGRQLLAPDIVVVTNVRVDHREEMGKNREAIARTLSQAIPPRATVFLPEEGAEPLAAQLAWMRQAAVRTVSVRDSNTLFPVNEALAGAVCRHVGVTEEDVRAGLAATRLDEGAARILTFRLPGSQQTHYLLNAFAANDPESSLQLWRRLQPRLPAAHPVGLLVLRSDRADRSRQWLEALQSKAWAWLRPVFVCGTMAPALARKAPFFKVLPERPPEKMLQEILTTENRPVLLVGIGNFVGTGSRIVRSVQALGEPRDS